MSRGKKTDPQLRSLIVRLRDDECYTFQQIVKHMRMRRPRKTNESLILHIFVLLWQQNFIKIDKYF